MDDLIGFIVFVVIAVVNLVAHANKNKKRREAIKPTGEKPTKPTPNTIEEFFESLAEKLEPQPVELPDWPDGVEKPDYIGELSGTETAAFREEQLEASILEQTPPPLPETESEVMPLMEKVTEVPSSSLKSTIKSMPSMIANTNGMRITSTPMLQRSSTGRIENPLKSRADLKKAILARIIFAPPRAYDTTFGSSFAE